MPDVEFAFLADAAEARPGQKFHVLGGGISRLGGPSFPLRHPHVAIVVGLLVTAAELDVDHALGFVLTGPGGEELSSAQAKLRVSGPHDGRDGIVTFAVDLWNLTFPRPGDYSIRILVDGSERKRLPIVVQRRPGTTALPPFAVPEGRA